MKEEQIDRIKSLLTKNLLSELDDSERSELNAWRESSPENEKLYNRLQNREYIKGRYKDYKRLSASRPGFRFTPSLKRIAAVLLFGIILGLSAYQLINEIKEQKSVTRNVNTEDVLLIVDGKKTINLNTVDINTQIENSCVKIDKNTIKYYPGGSRKVSEHRIIVPQIRMFKIILSDESVVWLNSKSTLSYVNDFKSSSRIVTLDGEGFFEVSKDSSRPFMVKTDGVNVNVTGTKFNVKAYDEDQNVAATLVEGKINIGFINNSGNQEGYNQEQGEQTVFDKEAGDLNVSKVNTSIYTSWKDGVYFFDRQRIEDIMKDLERWYGLEVIYKNRDIKDKVLSGKLNREETPEELLNTFSKMLPGHIKISGRTVTIY